MVSVVLSGFRRISVIPSLKFLPLRASVFNYSSHHHEEPPHYAYRGDGLPDVKCEELQHMLHLNQKLTEKTAQQTEKFGLQNDNLGLQREKTGLQSDKMGFKTEKTGLQMEKLGIEGVDGQTEEVYNELKNLFARVLLSNWHDTVQLTMNMDIWAECEVTLNELVVKIVFKFEVNEIMFDDVESWRFCYCFWSGYPSCILFDLVKNEFKLVFDHGIERILDTKIQYIGPESGGVVDISKDSKSGSKPGLVLTINVFDEKPSVITAGPELLWERLPGEPVAERMITDKETDEIVIFCKDRYFVCRRENGKRSREEHKLTQFHHEIINSVVKNIVKYLPLPYIVI
eukprot:XP_765182.1 hypothetical protein [Theileria parva strain Muguga]